LLHQRGPAILHAAFLILFPAPARAGIVSADFGHLRLRFEMPLFALGINCFELDVPLEKSFVYIRDLIFHSRTDRPDIHRPCISFSRRPLLGFVTQSDREQLPDRFVRLLVRKQGQGRVGACALRQQAALVINQAAFALYSDM